MTQEEKSLQRGAEWEQWGIRPWQATERSDRSGTSQNWNDEEMIRLVLTHQRGFSDSLSSCLPVTILLWLISGHCWVSWVASEDQYLQLHQALPASTASLLLTAWLTGWPAGANIRNIPEDSFMLMKYLWSTISVWVWELFLICNYCKAASNLQSRYSPSQLGRAFHWLDITSVRPRARTHHMLSRWDRQTRDTWVVMLGQLG